MSGIRTRLSVALVALVAVTVLAIGFGTYAFVEARLRESTLAEATRQAQLNLSVLVPETLPGGVTRVALDRSDLGPAIRLRGEAETIVDLADGGGPWVSTLSLFGALDSLPASLRSLVDGGRLAFAWTSVAGAPALVVGGRPAGGPPFYFVFPAASIDVALEQLRLGLAVAAVVAIVLALLAAGLISRGILRPIRQGSETAARVAAGDLTARVPVEGADELAAWAAEFNRMADALGSTIERLAASERQNRRFVAEVSHELRTPVTALVAEASLIETGLDELSPDGRRAAELLVADVRRLRDLVEELMELSRFDARAEAAELRRVDLAHLVKAAVAARLPGAEVRLAADPLIVQSDPRRLDRIVGNLLDNARVHAPGAAVEVLVRERDADGFAEVVVADRGPGVPDAVVPRLFERFFKADPSRRTGSSGLGLAIAAEHAALLGATLTAAPRDGGGLAVTLRLPVTGPLPGGDGRDNGREESAAVSGATPGPGASSRQDPA